MATRDNALKIAARAFEPEDKKRILVCYFDSYDGIVDSMESLYMSSVPTAREIIVLDEELDGDFGRVSNTISRLKKIYEDVKIIYIAGRSDYAHETRIRQMGVTYFLRRPLDLDLFKKVLKKIVDHETTKLVAG
jgi:DNA-binding NtrC family response regulator